MKENAPNKRFLSLISMMEHSGLESMKYFDHKSHGSLQEIFLLIGDTLHQQIIDEVNSSPVFSILVDEATDISVKCQMVIFIQYLDKLGKVSPAEYLGTCDQNTSWSPILTVPSLKSGIKTFYSGLLPSSASMQPGKLFFEHPCLPFLSLCSLYGIPTPSLSFQLLWLACDLLTLHGHQLLVF